MNRPWRLWTNAFWICAISIWVAHVDAQGDGLTAMYCSNFNTGANYQAVHPKYPSLGACQTQCKSSYAFAVVQGGSCWCSNYAPSVQLPIASCNYACQGYPYDHCGNPSQGLFGYLALSLRPAGTEGPASSSSPSPVTSTMVTTTQSAVQTSTSSVPSSPPVTVVGTNTKDVTQAGSTPSPSVYVVTRTEKITVSGAVITKQVTALATAPADPQTNLPPTASSQGISNGAIAGIVIGVIIGAALLGVLIWFCCCRPQRSTSEKDDADGGLGRNVSVLSRVGLLRATSQRSTHAPTNLSGQRRTAPPPMIRPTPLPSAPPRIDIPGTSPRYTGSGPDLYGDPVSAVSADSGGSGNAPSGKRASVPLFTDSRLNLNVITNHPNASKTSVSSLQDNTDYSRQLRVANPDS